MKTAEAAALLTIAAAYDNRKPDADSARAWALVLDGLRFEDCRDAIVAHYRLSTDWLMPASIIASVKRVRAKRIADYGPIEPPAGLNPDDTRGYSRYIETVTREIGDGTDTTPDIPELVDPPRDWRALLTKPTGDPA